MGLLVRRAITGGGSYKGAARSSVKQLAYCEVSIVFQEILYCFPWQTECPQASSSFSSRVYWCLTLKVIDIKCLREQWGKEVIVLVVKGKGTCLLESREGEALFL